ncbi:MAG: hypothetical protein SCK29_05750 [Bacillota bacterium]|nr:hypothetical protein [Bacillota bacterium]MDW7683609.1 hypothetical protein [Bacillota bacterium]
MQIKDRLILGMVAGLGGNAVKTLADEILLKQKISKRSFRSTAAGVWVSKEKEATNFNGQVLGALFDFGLGSMGGIGMTYLLSKTGRDHVLAKGVLSGIAVGSTITATLSAFPQNKVKPKDAASNLAYMFSHAIYGIITTATIAKLGHSSLFDVKPVNNYLPPTEQTTEERKGVSRESEEEQERITYH